MNSTQREEKMDWFANRWFRPRRRQTNERTRREKTGKKGEKLGGLRRGRERISKKFQQSTGQNGEKKRCIKKMEKNV